MLRSALLILSGNAFASLLLLARNLLVARMIPLADYGVASTFALVMAVVEMASAFGLQQQIVQAKDGDDPHFQAVLQGFQLLRGCVSGAALFVLAGPMAAFMGIPEVTWAYRLLALVPVLNALVHFDIHRLNRHMVFWPMILTGALPALVSVLVLWPLAKWFGDWRVLLYSILAQAGLSVLVSHLVAKRRWRLAFDARIIGQSLRFGWPLLANAVLLFLVFQGDRMIVGRELGMTTLAVFSMGLTLTLTPTLVLAKSVQNLFLPLLSAARHDPIRFQHIASVTQQLILLAGTGFCLAVLLLGPFVAHLLLGDGYNALLPLIFAFALQQALRVFKAAPALVALAKGHTSNAMIANGVRVCALPLCWYVAGTSGDLALILWIAIAAEVLSYATATMLLHKTRIKTDLLPHLVVAAVLSTGILCWSQADKTSALPDWPIWVAAISGMGVCLAAMPELRQYLRNRGHQQA